MNYIEFKKIVKGKFGGLNAEQVDYFFDKAVEYAKKGDISTSIRIGKDAFAIAKFAELGYEILYLVGLLCQLHLDNGQPEYAETYFKFGMKIIDENERSYNDDVNDFLDLKILIDSKMNK